MFKFFGLTFHVYGLVVGVAIVAVIHVFEFQSRHKKVAVGELRPLLWGLVVGSVIGARGWHVITDWRLYIHNWWQVLAVWQGGLSIIGAIIGGTAGAWLAGRWWAMRNRSAMSGWRWNQLADLMALSLPIGQVIGRLGNYINQELYGGPSQLPWAIFIDAEHRLSGYKSAAYYQPLFAYEMIALSCFAGGLWWFDQRTHAQKFGTGSYFGWYVWYYGVVRFSLDFVRLDKQIWFGTGLSSNQVVILLLLSAWGGWHLVATYKKADWS